MKLEGKVLMEIDTETVLKIARLSRIKINEGESADIQKDLNRIVEFVRSQKRNFPGITIPENSLSGDVKKYLQGSKSGGGTNQDDYADVLELSTGG